LHGVLANLAFIFSLRSQRYPLSPRTRMPLRNWNRRRGEAAGERSARQLCDPNSEWISTAGFTTTIFSDAFSEKRCGRLRNRSERLPASTSLMIFRPVPHPESSCAFNIQLLQHILETPLLRCRQKLLRSFRVQVETRSNEAQPASHFSTQSAISFNLFPVRRCTREAAARELDHAGTLIDRPPSPQIAAGLYK